MAYLNYEAPGQNAGSPSLPPLSPIEKQWQANTRAADIFNQICRMADLLAGPLPEACGANGVVKGGGGLFGEIEIGAEALLESAEEARRALDRIARLIPGER